MFYIVKSVSRILKQVVWLLLLWSNAEYYAKCDLGGKLVSMADGWCKSSMCFATDYVLWKAIPWPHWTKQLSHGEFYYGFKQGIGWYPKSLTFGNWKLGFFELQHNTGNIISGLFALKQIYADSDDGSVFYVGLHLVFSFDFFIFNVKYKCVCLNFFDIFGMALNYTQYMTNDQWKCYFMSYQKAIWARVLYCLLPHISIDLSWFD